LEKCKVVGLDITAERLVEIRKARIERTGFETRSTYADYDCIVKELEYSNQLFFQNGWAVIDVTNKSIEETAFEVLRLMRNAS